VCYRLAGLVPPGVSAQEVKLKGTWGGTWGQTGRSPAYGKPGKSMTLEQRGNVPSVPAFP
jgi:hypothetical protein